MSYEEYANLFLEQSNMPCEVNGTFIHRNGFTQPLYSAGDQVPDKGVHFNVSKDILGNISLIHTNEYDRTGGNIYSGMYAGSILRNGDYIYFYNAINNAAIDDYEMQICQYQISTGDKDYITVRHNSAWVALDISMALIEDKKLLVFDPYGDENYPYEDPHYWNIYIVDFNNMSCVTTLQVLMTEFIPNLNKIDTKDHNVQCVASVKNDNGDIHLFVLIHYEYYNHITFDDRGGKEFYHMDYTNSPGVWENIIVSPDAPDGFVWGDGSTPFDLCYFTIVDNRYLVTPLLEDWQDLNFWYTMTTLTFYVYDTLTNTTDYTHYNLFDTKWNGGWCEIESMKTDHSNNKVYFSMINYWNDNNYTGLFEFDVTTMQFTFTGIDSKTYESLKVLATGNTTYVYDYLDYKLYKSTNGQVLTFSFPPIWQNLCPIADDTEKIWYWDGTTSYIKAVDLSGTIIKSIDTGITPADTYTGIVHLGNMLIVTMFNESDYRNIPQYCKYYLIT